MQAIRRLRNTVGALALVALVSAGVVAAGVVTAGAQTSSVPAECDYTVSPVIVRPPGATVTVQGVATPGASIFVFVAGVLEPGMPITADPVTGQWIYQYFATVTAEVTVSFGTQYPPTPCGISPEQAEINRRAQAAARARSLPRTGGSNVESSVLVAVALVMVGAVLVFAVRRHEGLRGRP